MDTTKARSIKERIDKLDFIKIKNFGSAKDTVKRTVTWDFPGGPMGKTPCSQWRGPGFDPWPGN